MVTLRRSFAERQHDDISSMFMQGAGPVTVSLSSSYADTLNSVVGLD
jgi:hypothetical protein